MPECSRSSPGFIDPEVRSRSVPPSPAESYTVPGMAIPADCYRVVIVGHATGNEIFQFGWFVKGTAPTSDADANTVAGQWAAIWAANQANIKPLVLADSGFDSVKVYSYPAGGPAAAHVGIAPITGGVGTGATAQPLQSAMVITLGTGLSGRRNRGRIYLPANGLALATTHNFNNGDTLQVMNAIKAMFVAYNTPNAPNSAVVVVSSVGSTSNKVSQLSVDERTDTQRRRANRAARGTIQTATV